MIRVGLTGNVGSGKSEVGAIWKAAGVPVIDADSLAREAAKKGSPGLAEVVREFGEGILTADGELNRGQLREVVFRDADARRRLEGILHPRIGELRRQWVVEREREGAPLVVCEIPLLFESGAERDFDAIVLVHASEEEREERLQRDRGYSLEEARRIMASQGDADAKLARADHVLHNRGTREELRRDALALLARLGGSTVGAGEEVRG